MWLHFFQRNNHLSRTFWIFDQLIIDFDSDMLQNYYINEQGILGVNYFYL